jgi:hypothetical protein
MEVCQLVDDQAKAPVLNRYGFAGTLLAILVNASISRVIHAQETKEPNTEAAVIAVGGLFIPSTRRQGDSGLRTCEITIRERNYFEAGRMVEAARSVSFMLPER